MSIESDVAAALAHRATHRAEHDPQNGKLHGYCIVCGVPWPCETAACFLRPIPDAREDEITRLCALIEEHNRKRGVSCEIRCSGRNMDDRINNPCTYCPRHYLIEVLP